MSSGRRLLVSVGMKAASRDSSHCLPRSVTSEDAAGSSGESVSRESASLAWRDEDRRRPARWCTSVRGQGVDELRSDAAGLFVSTS